MRRLRGRVPGRRGVACRVHYAIGARVVDMGASIRTCDAAVAGLNQPSEEPMITDLIFRVVVNAVALLAAANVVPEFNLTFHNDKPEDWLKIAVIALVFALVNSYIKPIVKAVSLPIGFLTMGLVAFVINAAMLLGTAWIVHQAQDFFKIGFSIGGYPLQWGYEAIGCAVVASIVISIVATLLDLVLMPRKVVGL
jgi:putative membrane protein